MAQKEAFHQASPSEAFLMDCWYVAVISIVLCSFLIDQLSAMNSVASQSSSSGCVGGDD